MTPVTFALKKAEARLLDRLAQLEPLLDAGHRAAWREYAQHAAALAQIVQANERRGDLLTTGELAEQLNVSTRTIRRRKARGMITPVIEQTGKGERLVRWASR